MPFQPLPESDSSPSSSLGIGLGLFVIRLLTPATFFYYQLADHLNKARLFVWEKADWELAGQLGEKGLPFPGVVATVLVLLMTASFLAFAVGIFTRLNALVLFVLTAFILIAYIELSPSLNPQTLVLYLIVFLGLAIAGAGRVSLDFRLAGRRRSKK